MKLKITITNEQSEVLEQFHIEAPGFRCYSVSHATEMEIALAYEVYDYLGRRFEIPEDE